MKRRAIAALIGAAALALLLAAAWLRPKAEGHGTHTQFGLPPCSVMQATGYPCPSCGCTTAFAAATHGRLFSALRTQPFGALAALATAMAVLVAGYIALTGADLKPWLGGLASIHAVWGIAALIVVSWLYKIAQTAGVFS